MLKLLFIGDIVGRPGREVVLAKVPALRSELNLDFVLANAENAAAGAGVTGSICKSLLAGGVDAITLGDHVWDQRGWEAEIQEFDRVCRPANLPAACPGRRFVTIESRGYRLAVGTVLGRNFMGMKADCPFLEGDRLLAETVGQGLAEGLFLEIHAEATSEKQAMGWYCDGRAVAVIGTHTHVATADNRVLPAGTAFQCDAGMTGPYASVLGREVAPVISRFLDGMPRRFDVATEDVRLSGTVVTIDENTRLAVSCERLEVRL